MSFPRFYYSPITRGQVEMTGPEAHHMLHVMRMKEGDWVELFDGEGVLGRAVIRQAGSRKALLVWLGFAPQNLLFSPFAVVLVLVYVHLPFMVLPLYANLEKHDPLLLDAAQDLGASQWQRFWRITWPLSLPGVYAGAALVFIPSLGIFAVPDLVGGVNGIMIGNVIKQQFLETLLHKPV